MAARVLALDIGGTKLTAGVIADGGEVLAERVAPTNPSHPPDMILDAVLAMAEAARLEAELSQHDLSKAGVSFGGPVDFASGRTVTCHHLPGWEGLPLRDVIAERTGLPVIMDNDANAAALGEVRYGAARGCRHVLYLTVSTGVGGGVVLDGRVHRGVNSMAGEIGHTLVVPDGPVCTCGRNGCLEAVASGPAIARAAREAMGRGEPSALAAIPGDQLTAKEVAEAAAQDSLAARIMGEAGRGLGMAIAAAVNLMNPEMVVIGGGVSQAGEVLFRPLQESVRQHAVPASAQSVRIVPGALGPRGGLLGAAALCFCELMCGRRRTCPHPRRAGTGTRSGEGKLVGHSAGSRPC